MEYLIFNKNSGELIDVFHIENVEKYLKKYPEHSIEPITDYSDSDLDLFEEE
jgi:hypothetical protein